MCKCLNPRPYVDRLYGESKSDGKGLIIVEKCARIEKTLGCTKRLRFLLKEQEQLLTKALIEGVTSGDEKPKDKQH